MSFESHPRIMAFNVSLLYDIASYVDAFGALLPQSPRRSNSRKHKVLGGYLDRDDSDDLRAARLGIDCQPTYLTGGRVAFNLYWSKSLVQSWQAGLIIAEELTAEQLKEQSIDPDGSGGDT